MMNAYVATIAPDFDFETAMAYIQTKGFSVTQINTGTRQMQGKVSPEDQDKFEEENHPSIFIH